MIDRMESRIRQELERGLNPLQDLQDTTGIPGQVDMSGVKDFLSVLGEALFSPQGTVAQLGQQAMHPEEWLIPAAMEAIPTAGFARGSMRFGNELAAGNYLNSLTELLGTYANLAPGAGLGDDVARMMFAGTLIGPRAKSWLTRKQIAPGIPEGAFSSLYDKRTMLEVPDDKFKFLMGQNYLGQPFNPAVGGRTVGSFGQVVDHPTILQDYPELAGAVADVTLGPNIKPRGYFGVGKIPEGQMGSYHQTFPLMIRAEADKEDLLHDIGIHEISHAIDWMEGRATGAGDIRKLGRLMSKDLERVETEIGFLERQIERAWPEGDKIKELRTRLDEEVKKQQGLRTVLDDLATQYRNNLSEIYARDTEYRSYMDALGRSESLPHPKAGTEGLAPDAQLAVLNSDNIPLEDAIARYEFENSAAKSLPEDIAEEQMDSFRISGAPSGGKTGKKGSKTNPPAVRTGNINTIDDFLEVERFHTGEESIFEKPYAWISGDGNKLYYAVRKEGQTVPYEYDLSGLPKPTLEEIKRLVDRSVPDTNPLPYPNSPRSVGEDYAVSQKNKIQKGK